MKIKKSYSFDDLFLVPKYSEINSRADVDLSVDLGKGIKLENPVICANMKTIAGPQMVGKLAALGSMGILHRFDNSILYDFREAIKFADFYYESATKKKPTRYELSSRIGISVGLDVQRDFLKEYEAAGGKVVCVDIAHGHHKRCLDLISNISSNFNFLIIAGNVATGVGAYDLHVAGADVIKAGVGSGSICSTRIETGNGVPQMTVLDDIKKHLSMCLDKPPKLISDGGMRCAGDVVKSLCFSDAVMLGNILAGTDETPGDIISFGGKKYKQYAGSSTHKSRHIEGVISMVPAKGPVENVLTTILEGVRSGCSYQGVSNLQDLKKDPEFVEVSNSGLIESRPHDVILG